MCTKIKIYVPFPFFNFYLIKKETPFDSPTVDLHLGLPFYFPFLPSPLKRSGAWSRLGPEALEGLALPT
jgi:hypothetical protein